MQRVSGKLGNLGFRVFGFSAFRVRAFGLWGLGFRAANCVP